MSQEDPIYYHRPNVILKPLADCRYAWPYLIPPATAARNPTERHLKMDSMILEFIWGSLGYCA